MAQPTVPASTKLRIKLKGVPRVQSAPPKGSAQAVRASLQLQDLRAAVEAFSKQGVGGLPEGVLLDPWNEEAVLQAQQEVVPGLTAVQYPASSTVRVRKRRAAAPAEFSLAELGPQYVIWGRHKRQRSQHPKRLAKSSAQLSSSLQRVLGGGQQTSSQRGASAASKQPHQQQQQQQQQPQRHSSAGPEQRKQRHQQQQQQQQRQAPVQILPRPPSPRLDDDPLLLVSPPPFQLHPHQQLPYIAPLDVQAAVEPSLLQMGPAGQLPSPMDVQASAGPQLLHSGAAVAVPVASAEVQRQPEPAVRLAKPAAQALPEQAAVVEQQSEPVVDAAPSVPAQVRPQEAPVAQVPAAAQQEAKQQPEQRQEQPPPQRQPQTASQREAAAVAKPAKEQQEQAPAPPAKPEAAPEAAKQQQAAAQAAPAARQQAPAPAPVSKAEQEIRQQEQQAAASPAEVYTDGIATRLRRKKVAEQPEPTSSQPPPKQPKQAKGKQKQQKQKQEASQEDSAPPAKKARTAEQSPAAAAGSNKDAAADVGSKAAPAKAAATKAAATKAAPAKGAAKGKAAAVEKKAVAQAPAKAPAAAAKGAGTAAAKAAAPVAVKAEAASPAKPAGGTSKAAPAAAKVNASAAVKQGAAGAGKGAAAAAVKQEHAPGPVASGSAAAAKPESPPSETSHQQPMAAAVPQHMQQLQPPLQSLVPQLPQEQTAVSRDRSQCSLQQPAESPAAAASAGAAGGLNAAGAAGAAGALGQLGGSAGPGAAGPAPQPKRHLLELEASAMTPAALALGNLVVPTVTFKSVLPERPVSSQEEAQQYLEGMFKEARHRKHQGDNRSKTGGWDVYALTLYARSALEFLRYWDATQRIHKQLQEAGKPADVIKRRLNGLNSNGLLKQVSQLCTSALQNAGNCKGQDVQKQALRMLLERLCAICQLRHLHSQKEGLSQHANLLKGAASASAASGSASSKAQRPGSGRPPARAVAAAAAAAAGGSSPKGKQAFNKRSPDDSNTSNQERVQLPGMLAAEQHSPGLAHGSSPGGGGGGPGGGSAAGASQERALMIAESTCAEHLSELLKITDGMHQTVMRMQQFLESPEVLADDDARGAALHISTLGLDAGMFSVPRVVAHAEAALVCIVRSGRRGMARTAS